MEKSFFTIMANLGQGKIYYHDEYEDLSPAEKRLVWIGEAVEAANI